MMSVTTVFQGRLSQDTSVRLVQNAWQYSPQGRWGGSATLDLGGRHSSADAVSAIMQIILDAKGNASVSIDAPQATASVGTGDGDDVIDINAREVRGVSSGRGDDAIYINAGQDVGTGVGLVRSGAGDDHIDIEAGGLARGINGGSGSDDISIKAHEVQTTYGGSGDDIIDVVSETGVLGIFGGDGNDTISIDAAYTHLVMGGRGDDHLVLHNTTGGLSTIFLSEGDGNDVVETSSPLEIFRSSADGTRGMNDATITKVEDGIFAIVFANSNDTLVVKLTGAMAEADEIVFEHHPVGGAMIIRPADSKVGTTHVATFTRSDFQTSTNRE